MLHARKALALVLTIGCSGSLPPRSPCDAASADTLTPQMTGRAPTCLTLVPTADLTASGSIELHRVRSSPFTVSVDSAGHQLIELDVILANLPDPATLGAYSAYVAWAITPDLARYVRLGEVRNGRTSVGVVGLNQFLVMISAEASADTRTHAGKAVLNGMSPSMALQPHDALPITSGTTAMPPMHGMHTSAAQWMMPPMHPQVPQMVPGVESLVPAVPPWLPGASAPPGGIPAARPREMLTVRDGDSISLVAGLVRRTIAGRSITMYGINGQSPGPLIRVAQNARIVVDFTNALDQPTSIHWHGVRLDNRFDGTPMVTQQPVAPGGRFHYEVHFPDAGIYWYHSHVREDAQQDLGLYGNLFVQAKDAAFLSPVDREEVLLLDDFLLDEHGGPVPYGVDAATHALMGRFGNLFFVNGSPDYTLAVTRGNVVRLYLTNASSTRVFNISLPGTRMKLVGGDMSPIERDTWVSSVVIGPAERYIVDVRFDSAGPVPLVNHVQGVDRYRGVFFDEVDTMGTVIVSGAGRASAHATAFDTLRTNSAVVRDIDRLRSRFTGRPDYTLRLTLDTAQTLPFELWQMLRNEVWPGTSVEWTGTMPMMDWLATSHQVRWVLRDSATGRENMDVAWRFRVGDVVRLRLVNDARILHPMQHPIHIHGQRFLVTAVDGDSVRNLLWKDTALVPAGSTVDLLVEMTNPGKWMLHCHIAEHMESGMHLVFEVIP